MTSATRKALVGALLSSEVLKDVAVRKKTVCLAISAA